MRPFFIKRKKTGIHRDQIISREGIDETVDLRNLVITDHVADRRIDDHDLECRGDTAVSSHHKVEGEKGTINGANVTLDTLAPE